VSVVIFHKHSGRKLVGESNGAFLKLHFLALENYLIDGSVLGVVVEERLLALHGFHHIHEFHNESSMRHH